MAFLFKKLFSNPEIQKDANNFFTNMVNHTISDEKFQSDLQKQILTAIDRSQSSQMVIILCGGVVVLSAGVLACSITNLLWTRSLTAKTQIKKIDGMRGQETVDEVILSKSISLEEYTAEVRRLVGLPPRGSTGGDGSTAPSA